ncbi:MAG: class I SAM-dependent RNA methyltransferase [Candidatus Protochlamydia sp.]|nr:class I SAM-dependent RNA methyltransferase [Candidatus Protochlamydia sp.]
MIKINDIIEGTIQTIAFGGEGILRHLGLVVFIPFTAPGDQITCRVIEIKKNFAKGEIVKVIQPASGRATPLCPYFGTCGGCQLQHLTSPLQLNYKLNAVKDALKRIGHLTLPDIKMVPANLIWSYRRHITLHLKPEEGSFKAGYIGTDHQSLIIVQTCPIFNLSDDPIIQQLQEFISQLSNTSQLTGRVTVLKNEKEQFILSFQFDSLSGLKLLDFQKGLQKYPAFAGIFIHTPEEDFAYGNLYCEQKQDDIVFRFTPQAFVQNHPEQSANIYKEICELALKHPVKHILDLYCGFGMTSLLLARLGHHVTGIEFNRASVQFAQENTHLNHLKQVNFIQGDVEKELPNILKKTNFDLVLMNPPRTGLSKKIIEMLLRANVKELIYVSCMPATLARDLALFCEKNYEFRQCTVYDMFPQTAHVETLVHLKIRENNRSIHC